MRCFLSIAILFFYLAGFSQTAKTKGITISREKVKGVKTIKDLICDIPKDCKVKSFVLSLVTSSGLKESTMIGEEFAKETVNSFSNPGSIKKIIIEELKTECPASVSKNYTILIE